jgi:hypothetical protein
MCVRTGAKQEDEQATDDGSGRVLHMRLHAFPAYIIRPPLFVFWFVSVAISY